ncbi:MAG: DUF1016 domain-containing protein [Bacilli bacterium]|jgi:predicted nuclease of restriction endonuclease-like (RecB) superfamily|nr:DUF1016 domain-containing protein [Bacilli bacterium]
MKENGYYNEIENYIKRNEINKKRRVLEENYDALNNYWNIGRLLVEAQGGQEKAKYGDELIKKWSFEYSKRYGNKYSYRSLYKMRQFFCLFPILPTLSATLSWSHIVEVLSIKDGNVRNYYLNKCIMDNLTVRSLREEIKSNSYERLINKPKNIELIIPKKEYTILEDIKNPIIIKIDKNKMINNEKDLELTILSEITFVLTQLGRGFAFIGNQYKINNYYIDILLFNIELNCYVVVELKIRKLKVEDKAQVEMYMKLVDENIKKATQNKTMGIIIFKEQDKFVVSFIKSDTLIPLTYELINK